MQAMDEELARAKLAKSQAQSQTPKSSKQTQRHTKSSTAKGKMKATALPDAEEYEDSDLEAMHAELNQSLARDADGSDDEAEEMMDYGLMKNFLESFKSQAGLAGPVGSLVGRLEPNWTLPRDESG